MKYIFLFVFCFLSIFGYGQEKQDQYLLIIRSKEKIKASDEVIKSNIQHWTSWMTTLAKNHNIVGGYRFPTEGVTISGANKTVKDKATVADGKMISSILVIRAKDLSEAKQIASACPVFELGGTVEIKTIQQSAN